MNSGAKTFDVILFARIAFAAAGIALVLYGVYRFFTEIPWPTLVALGTWLLAALIIHDGLVSPLIIGIGVALRRFVPDRARRYLQFGLIVGGMITVIAIPLIIRQGTHVASKAWLLQPYGRNLAILLGLVAAGTLVAYAIKVARDHQPVSSR